MSSFAGIAEATDVLTDHLRDEFLAEPALAVLFGAGGHIVSSLSPTEMRDSAQSRSGLSVWLYRVERDPTLTNRPPVRVSATTVRHPPLPLNLHYLVTPLSDTTDNEQLILGKALEVLNDHTTHPADPARPALTDVLRLSLENLDLESITRIWSALEARYELSVSYVAQLVNIESGRSPRPAVPVLERIQHQDQIVGVR